MRFVRVLVCALLTLNSASSPSAMASTTSATEASVLIQQSLSALNGGQIINDVTISANAQMIEGSDNETGTATLQAVVAGASRTTLAFAAGQRVEIINASVTPPSGTWSGPDATVHSMANHNVLTGPFWFFPAFALATSSSASGAVITYVGHEIHNDQAVEHLTISQAPASYQSAYPLYAHLTQLDFFLDSTTFLPAALDFVIHPDNNELQDIPVEIRFLSYGAVNGAQISSHVEKFVNNTLALDLQFQSTSLNTGITVSQLVGN